MINLRSAGDGVRGGQGRRGGSAGSLISAGVPTLPPAVPQAEAESRPMIATRKVGRSCSGGGSSSTSNSRVAAGGPAIVAEAPPPCPGLPVEDGDHPATASTAIKSEEVALSASILVAAAGPDSQGGPAAHRGADGRNKRKGRSSPASTESNTGAASSPGNRSSKTTSRGSGKRARRTGSRIGAGCEGRGQG